MTRVVILACLSACALLGACAHQGPSFDLPGGETLAGGPATSVADTASFAETMALHQGLPIEHRSHLRAEAERLLGDWLAFEQKVDHAVDSRLRHWFNRDNPSTLDHVWVGLGNSILDLKAAADLDPTFALAWSHLGRLCLEAGDLISGRKYLETALLAATAEARGGRPLATEEMLILHRNRAWALRDLGLWDEGLAAVRNGLEFHHGDQELVLIKGLLLAGAGRYEEALSLAVRMPPLEYPQYDFLFRGLKNQTSGYANNWIRSQALLAEGDLPGAYRALGDLAVYAYRGYLPFSSRYWRDAGLVAELVGDPAAPTYYSVGYVTGRYRSYFPHWPGNVGSQVLDFPDPRIPVFASYGDRFHVGGSPLAFVALQINRMSMGMFAEQRAQAAGRALHLLEILDRRGIRPDLCHALRGRVFFGMDDFQPARSELAAARAAFGEQGLVDTRTSMMLGLLDVRQGRYADAARMLEEALTEDDSYDVAWRSLGIACSHLGDTAKALTAMNRAVAMDPWSVAGFYNRGLLHFQMQDFPAAVNDLTRAQRLDPENREVQRMLQMATNAGLAAGQGTVDLAAGESAELPGPEELAAGLMAEIENYFSPADTVAGDPRFSDIRIAELQTAYQTSPDPRLRAAIAFALIQRSRLPEAQALLAPGWGLDLSPQEELMLLFVDRNLGELQRAEEVIQDLLASAPGVGDPYLVVLATETMRTGTDPVGNDTHTIADHGFFHWWRDARSGVSAGASYGHFRQDPWLFNRYADDIIFEQAVWGMSPTPVTGGFSAGTGAGGDK